MELEAKITQLEAEMAFLRLLANKALDIAMETKIELLAMKKSTHQVIAQPLTPEVKEFIEEVTKAEESEPVPQIPARLSPFTLSGFHNRRATLAEQLEAQEDNPEV